MFAMMTEIFKLNRSDGVYAHVRHLLRCSEHFGPTYCLQSLHILIISCAPPSPSQMLILTSPSVTTTPQAPPAKKAKAAAAEVDPNASSTVFVGNMAWATDEQGLRALFDGVGEITSVRMGKRPYLGPSSASCPLLHLRLCLWPPAPIAMIDIKCLIYLPYVLLPSRDGQGDRTVAWLCPRRVLEPCGGGRRCFPVQRRGGRWPQHQGRGGRSPRDAQREPQCGGDALGLRQGLRPQLGRGRCQGSTARGLCGLRRDDEMQPALRQVLNVCFDIS